MEDIEVTDQYHIFTFIIAFICFIRSRHRSWADECAKMFGGLDIFALDTLHSTTGKYALSHTLSVAFFLTGILV